MTNIELLNKVIEEKGVTKTHIANKMGISRNSLYKKLQGESLFNQYEIKVICEVLNITSTREKDAIFFA